MMPSRTYHDNEILLVREDVKVLGNGTVTAGTKFINNDDVRVDVIVVKRGVV